MQQSNQETSNATPSGITGYGAPEITSDGVEVLSVHLHRFLTPWLEANGVDQVHVVMGFEGSAAPTVTFLVSSEGASLSDLEVDYARLVKATRNQDDSLSLVQGKEQQQQFAAVPVVEHHDEDMLHYSAFVLLPVGLEALRQDAKRNDLANRAAQAVRTFRSNAVRMLFEEQATPPIKEFLYDVLARLPEWCGVDHSAAIILTGNLEAMALNSSEHAEFEVVTERLYYPKTDAEGRNYERLVGLVIEGEENSGGLLGFAFNQVQNDDDIGLHIFVPDDDTSQEWHLFGHPEQSANRFATRVHRPREGMTVLVPLLSPDSQGNSEMLGFLSLNYRNVTPIGPVANGLLKALAQRLAGYLLRSPLFSLSARQLLVLERVRAAYDKTIGQGGARLRLGHFIDEVSDLITTATGVPTFAVGHITITGGRKILRFTHPRGFTRFSSISLPVEAPQEVSETSIAALAVRLARPLVLSGGSGADHQFKNDIFVNEMEGLTVDARRVDPESVSKRGHWRRLSEYYKPSRERSYASLAFPISLGHEVLGVIALEVDRETDWLWWTGFGSQIFYRLLANEIAVGFKLMGVPNL